MILTKTLKLKVSRKTITHFRNKGYEIKLNDIINIKPSELTDGSHIKVDVKCDVCGTKKTIMYQKYIKNINNGGFYACSSKCAQEKVKKTSLNKFGSEYYMQTDAYKKSIEKTSLEKYGTNHHLQSNKIKSKIVKTNLEKYGVDNPSKSKIIKDKIKNTFIERYGVDNISKLDSIKNKISLTNISYFKDNYNLLILSYNNNLYTLECEHCKDTYEIHKKTLRNRLKSKNVICTKCNPIQNNVSGLELLLLKFIKENYDGKIISNSKKIINPLELDIYLPDLNLAFEFNGVYWHNELNKPDDYHKNKSDFCDKKGIQLIHIWEDDWVYKRDILKSMILNKIGKSPERIFGRKTVVKKITDNKLIKSFLENNHVQGYIGASIKLGLFYDDELVSLMTFGKLRKPLNSKSRNDNEYEMLRFCNKLNTNVIGGASKLFKYFIVNFNPENIITYADRSYSNGNLYNQLGFNFVHITTPNYYYVIDNIRNHRFGFRKDILVKQGYDITKTEHEIMLERKIYRIYNSGNYKFIYQG